LISFRTIYATRHVLTLYRERLNQISSTNPTSNLLPTLQKCGALFAADVLRRELGELALETAYLNSSQVQSIRLFVFDLSKELRRDVIGLTDGI
jgi:hypothetical protein